MPQERIANLEAENTELRNPRCTAGNVGVTLGLYSHMLPSMQRDAAAAMERVLRA